MPQIVGFGLAIGLLMIAIGVAGFIILIWVALMMVSRFLAKKFILFVSKTFYKAAIWILGLISGKKN